MHGINCSNEHPSGFIGLCNLKPRNDCLETVSGHYNYVVPIAAGYLKSEYWLRKYSNVVKGYLRKVRVANRHGCRLYFQMSGNASTLLASSRPRSQKKSGDA